MKTSFSIALLIFAVIVSGCRKPEEIPAPQAPKDAESAAPANYLSTAGKAMQSMEKQVDAASLNNAVQLFSVQEGRAPESLDELVQKKYLSKLPIPPAGMKLHYDKAAAKVTVIKE